MISIILNVRTYLTAQDTNSPYYRSLCTRREPCWALQLLAVSGTGLDAAPVTSHRVPGENLASHFGCRPSGTRRAASRCFYISCIFTGFWSIHLINYWDRHVKMCSYNRARCSGDINSLEHFVLTAQCVAPRS